ncbi:pimeloyl-ACP methyl ester carboxylesterase [Kribbella voronezhensis]|uniref:Pimeloyl-ACP methyl ester carboxylesterase n=1 Tax=Kribbella voronezhensis TaxID=2512212 RepID=A0A4R7SY22_9ACTN|nr:alpha/beta hydrolase [Kribbella voronezhensis]TDU84204.1 pimeloyl-ACP methyl ester carboxylesterase [Kribbella voronezhensis]
MTLHHVSHGEGIPVLALHGWTPDHRLMTGPLEPFFADVPGYRRLYPDLPGMGASPAGTIDSSDGIMAALIEFIDTEIGDEPFVLIGESYGGYLARGLVAQRPSQVLGLGLICPIGTALEHAERTVPDHVVLQVDPGLVESLSPQEVEDFTEIAVIQTAETLRQYRADVLPGLDAADAEAMDRIRKNWALTVAPESGPVYERPTLVLCGRQDSITGYADQYALLPHYPRATYAVLDRAGHNLQIEQAGLMGVLLRDWLERVAREVN